MVQYTASQTSLVKSPSSMTEMYIPLWVYSSGNVSAGGTTTMYVQKGTTNSENASTTLSTIKLHTLNSSWPSAQKFAFEASVWSSSGTLAAYVTLYDCTASALVSSSQISSTSTTATVIRSSQFTLTPGHVYGVAISSASTNSSYMSKAHLVAFL